MDLWKNRNWKVMLLSSVNKPFDSEDYLYELKFDGVRCVCFANKKEVTLISRNGTDMTHLFPELNKIKNLVKGNVIFEGEIVSIFNGKPSFSKLQERLHLKNKKLIFSNSVDNPVIFVAFDILYESKNLIDKSLILRKEILDKYSENSVFVKSVVFSEGVRLFNEVKKMKLEGIVAKLKDGKYHINERTDDFIKIKNVNEDVFSICGYVLKDKYVFSILLGEEVNGKYFYVGKVSISKNNPVYDVLIKTRKRKNFLDKNVKEAFFISPKYKCTIEYLERTSNGSLRHPIFKGVSDE